MNGKLGFTLIVLFSSLLGYVKDSANSNLIDLQVIGYEFNIPLKGWNKKFRPAWTLESKPPVLQVFTVTGVGETKMLVDRYDMSKGVFLERIITTNLDDYFKLSFTNGNPLTNFVPFAPFDGNHDDKAYLRIASPKEIYPFVDFDEVTDQAKLLSFGNRKIYVVGGRRVFENDKQRKNFYFTFIGQRKNGKWASVVRVVEPRERWAIVPRPLEWPLNDFRVLFLKDDLDGDGIDELICASGGPEHDRAWFAFNIFNLKKFIEYLKL